MITEQPTKTVFNLSILNAHEFQPHPLLNQLIPLDTLLITEQSHATNPFGLSDTKNCYHIVAKDGRSLFWAIERNTFCRRLCCGKNRPYYVTILNQNGEKIIEMCRPYRCGSVCCCLQELFVYSPPGNLIGTIQETCNPIFPRYKIYDSMLPETPLFNVKVPFCTCACLCGDVDFPVVMTGRAEHNKRIGVITKKWGGIVRELFTDADTFGVNFPITMEPKHKAMFLCACLFIDFMYFERDR